METIRNNTCSVLVLVYEIYHNHFCWYLLMHIHRKSTKLAVRNWCHL